jgi:two-component system sensor histidine kinase TctE
MATEKQHRQNSVFGEIVDWTLAPLLILWPISMAIQYFLAYTIANNAYDRELQNRVFALARQVAYQHDRVVVSLPPAAAAVLRFDEVDEIFFQVRDQRNVVVAGDKALPVVEFSYELEPNTVYFRDDVLPQHEVRVAYTFAQLPGLASAVLVQVAETNNKRSNLASQIIGDVLAAQFIIVPVALLFVWLGLEKGLEPLNELQDQIRRRKPGDLAPIRELDAPEEVRPLIRSINDLMERLEASMKAQQRFVADAAHQMRTPLAGLKMQAELAMRQRDVVGVQQSMRQIAASADRASHLINQLLLLARADADAPPPMQRVDLERVAQLQALEWVPRAMEREIDLGFEGTGYPAWIEGNALLLQELANNLIDNALRYTRAGGRVTVRVVQEDGEAVLEVEDNGIGIDETDRDLVFERFYRVLGTETDGSGLGLAIVRGIADLHRARVRLVPNPHERGTIARAAFPRSEAEVRPLRTAA